MKNCVNCANYDRPKMQHTDVCGTCVKCETKYTNWKPIPVTYGDQIRAENNDELKVTIHAFSLGFKPWCDFHCENEGDDDCDKCIENWLHQPVEES